MQCRLFGGLLMWCLLNCEFYLFNGEPRWEWCDQKEGAVAFSLLLPFLLSHGQSLEKPAMQVSFGGKKCLLELTLVLCVNLGKMRTGKPWSCPGLSATGNKRTGIHVARRLFMMRMWWPWNLMGMWISVKGPRMTGRRNVRRVAPSWVLRAVQGRTLVLVMLATLLIPGMRNKVELSYLLNPWWP